MPHPTAVVVHTMAVHKTCTTAVMVVLRMSCSGFRISNLIARVQASGCAARILIQFATFKKRPLMCQVGCFMSGTCNMQAPFLSYYVPFHTPIRVVRLFLEAGEISLLLRHVFRLQNDLVREMLTPKSCSV